MKTEENKMSISVVYWSGTGNTQAMAEAVAEGIREAGADAAVMEVSEADAGVLSGEESFALGCPSMGAEQLEEGEFEPMFSACEAKLAGQKLGLFGSYGWGDGEWMRTWEATCREDGANLVSEGVICNEAPDGEAEAACQALGKALA